jgi:glycosyltransferase involved in cell wall biosynthesis
MYMGSFFYFSGLPEVIESMAPSPSTFKLVLVGGGEQEVELKSLVRERGLEDMVLFAGFIPFDKLPDVLTAADVAINPMHRTLVSNAALPNKVLQYLACKVPVVATRLDGLYATFGDSAPIAWVDSPSEVISRAVSFLSSHKTPDFSRSDSFLDSLGAESVAIFEHSLREMKGLT